MLVVGRITLARDPAEGFGALAIVVAVLLALLAAWTLLSARWSDASGRAVVEYARVLLYVLAFVLLGSVGRSPRRLRRLVRGIGLGVLVVCACAFVSRALPEVWPTEPGLAEERLSFPLTYWNALGILAAIGVILGFGLSADGREHPAVRVIAAAALPVLAVTLLLTFSRGAIAAGAAGLIGAVLLGRSASLVSATVAALPVVLAVRAGYGADLLASENPTAAAAVTQGRDLALTVAVCTLAAALLRLALVWLDRRMARVAAPAALRHPAVVVAAVVLAVGAAAGAAVALGAPEKVERQYDRFIKGDQIREGGDVRSRLTDPGNNGRLDQWRVASRESRGERLHGTGAGTYALLWERARADEYQVEDAHSLYLEMLAELGIVGLVLLLAVLLIILGALVWRARGPDRGVHAALFGAIVAWALHAGIDWHWEMPAVTAWVFAAGGAVLARPARETDAPSAAGMGRVPRVVAALGILLVAVTPARLYLSEAPLQRAKEAFARGDCPTAIDQSLDSIAALGVRPQPFEILGFCDVRLGHPELAVRAFRNAVARDPGDWEFRYGLAVARASAGLDPRPEAAAALERNPLSPVARDGVRRFATDDPRKWRRRALSARLPRD